MNFTRLTTEQRRSFDKDGFLVVPNALPAETVRQLIEAGDRLAEAFLKKPELIDRPRYNHVDLRPGLLREDALLALVANASTVPLVIQLLSPQHSSAFYDTHLQEAWNARTRQPSEAAGIET